MYQFNCIKNILSLKSSLKFIKSFKMKQTNLKDREIIYIKKTTLLFSLQILTMTFKKNQINLKFNYHLKMIK